MNPFNSMAVKYTGQESPFRERIYGSGLVFRPNETQWVIQPIAEKLLRHTDTFQPGTAVDANPWGAGGGGSADGAFLVANNLNEIAADPSAQTQAQTNLGLGTADPLSYYILAKA